MSKFNFDPDFFRRVISKSNCTNKIKSLSQLVNEAVEAFYDEFDYYPDIAAFAPGKFTIMGDHLDYINGKLVQAALPMATVIVGKALDTVKCKVVTTSTRADFPRKAVFPIYYSKKVDKMYPDWANFLKGVISVFPNNDVKGFDALIHSNVPISQSYGSSAALQVGFYTFLEAVCGKKFQKSKEQRGYLCRKAEIKSQMCERRIGQWDNITSSVAEGRLCVKIDCRKSHVSSFQMRDTNILFMLIYPNFELEVNDRSLIIKREMELKLAATLVDLDRITDVKDSHLEMLEKMGDPTREVAFEILQNIGYDDDIINDLLDDLFREPESELATLELQSSREQNLGEAESKIERDAINEFEDLITADEKSFAISSEIKRSNLKFPPSPPPSPVSYIHKRIGELCKEKTASAVELSRPCVEVNCLPGLENVSELSATGVNSKLIRRLRYVLTETKRCEELSHLVSQLDYTEFGTKLIQSHLSLKTDFEVSCSTLDTIVELAGSTERVLGAKMMSGGGVLTLLHRSVAEEFVDKVVEKFGNNFQFYLVFPSPGADIIRLGLKKNPVSILSDYYPNCSELMKKAVQNFEATYKYRPTHGSYSPGALDFLGDHTDHNYGYILAMAVNMLTVIVGGFNGTSKIRVATADDTGDEPRKVIFGIPLLEEFAPGRVKWAKLIRGAIARFPGSLQGFDCFIQSSLPSGIGFSSKISFIVSFFTFLETISGYKIADKSKKAFLCMRSVQESTNMLCGIGDFSVAIKSKENYSLLLDCRSGLSNFIPIHETSVLFLLTVAKKGKSNEAILYSRMEDCYQVAKALGGKTLRCLKEKELKRLAFSKVPQVAIRRAKHIIRENERVLRAAEALKNNDYEEFGEIMVASHISLRDNYEATTPELDFLVERAMEVDGVLGSKMPSGGYDSCTLTLVKRWAVDDLIEYLQKSVSDKLKFYVITPYNCAGELNIKKFVETLPSPQYTFEDIFPF